MHNRAVATLSMSLHIFFKECFYPKVCHLLFQQLLHSCKDQLQSIPYPGQWFQLLILDTLRHMERDMKQVSNLFEFMRGTKDCNWHLHPASLKTCVYFFAFNRHDYVQNIPEHLACMYQLETSHPLIWNDLQQSSEFVVSTNPTAFTSIGPDQTKEQDAKLSVSKHNQKWLA